MKCLTFCLNVKVTGLHNIGMQSQYLNVFVSMFIKWFPVICDLKDTQFIASVAGCCCYVLFEPDQLFCNQQKRKIISHWSGPLIQTQRLTEPNDEPIDRLWLLHVVNILNFIDPRGIDYNQESSKAVVNIR